MQLNLNYRLRLYRAIEGYSDEKEIAQNRLLRFIVRDDLSLRGLHSAIQLELQVNYAVNIHFKLLFDCQCYFLRESSQKSNSFFVNLSTRKILFNAQH